jgi:4-hydroxy-2-oxoheptanedioate aldolase
MQNPKNTFKQALREKRAQIGLWATLSSNYVTEVLAGAGFDWILIDTEHSPADLENVLGQLQAVSAYPSHPIVRVPWNDMVTIKRYLDLGVQTLLIPQVTTAEEARNAVAYARYPQGGMRGVAGATRATRFGRIQNYFTNAAEEICILLQVESGEALQNIDAIAAVDGVDGVFVGPADLHASLGYLGERANPDILLKIDDAVKQIVRTGKAAGILVDADLGRRYLDLGATFVAVGSDVGLLARASDGLAAKFKG